MLRSRVPRVALLLAVATAGIGGVATAVAGTPGNVRRIERPCGEQICDDFERPTATTLDALALVGLDGHGYAAAMTGLGWVLLLGYVVLGAVLLRARITPLTLACAVGLVGLGLTPFLSGLAHAGGSPVPGHVNALVGQVALAVMAGQFPDGRWHPRFLRWAWPPLALLMLGTTAVERSVVEAPDAFALLGTLGFLFLVGAQVHRYVRVSDRAARQQTQWVLAAIVLLGANVTVAGLLQAAGLLGHWQLLIVLVAHVSFALLGLGFALALLRHRLYDAGLVLRRTTVYGLGVAGLLAAYLGLVALASLSLARGTASVLGATAVAALALGIGLATNRLGGWLRGRVVGPSGTPGAVAAALAEGITTHGRTADAAGSLAAAVARVLAVEHVEVRRADGTAVSSHGHPAAATHEVPVRDDGTQVGVLALGPDRPDRRVSRALEEVLPFVVLVLRGLDEAESLWRSRTAAATAREDERLRLRRDLHDGVGPLLASQLLTVDTIRLSGPEAASELVQHLGEQARSALAEVRRITRDLRPPILDIGGLPAALREEAERFTVAGLTVELSVDELPDHLSAAVEVGVLRIVQEALGNVVRHAEATRAVVTVAGVDGRLLVRVCDDGRGLQPGHPGVGTASMRERTEELGGTLTIGPAPRGRGTQVEGVIPR